MVISQPLRNNPSYYYRASPTLPPNLLWILQNACSPAITLIRPFINGAKHIFYTNQIHGGSSADCSLFICRSRSLLFISRTMTPYFKNTLYEDLSTLTTHTSVGCFPSRMPASCALYLRNQYQWVKTFLIFDINHQQNTYERSDQIGNDKTSIQTTTPLVSHGRFYDGSRVAIF